MTEPPLIRTEITLLHELDQLVAERAKAEARIEAARASGTEAAQREFQEASRALTQRLEAETAEAQREARDRRQAVTSKFDAEQATHQADYQALRQKIAGRRQAEQDAAKEQQDTARWEAGTLFEAAKTEAKSRHEQDKKQLAEDLIALQEIRADARAFLQECRLGRVADEPPPAAPPAGPPGEATLEALGEAIAEAEARLQHLRALGIAKQFKGIGPIAVFILIGLVALFPLALLIHPLPLALGVAAAVTLVLGGLVSAWLFAVARSKARARYGALLQALADAEDLARRCDARETARAQERQAELARRHDDDLRKADQRFEAAGTAIRQRHDDALRQVEGKYPPLLADIARNREAQSRQAEEDAARRPAEIRARHEREMQQVRQKYERLTGEVTTTYQGAWAALEARWHQGLARIHAAVEEVQREGRILFPEWAGTDWSRWVPPTATPPAIRFGEFPVDLAQIPNGLPKDPRLQPVVPTGFTLPALLPFPEGCSVLFKAADAGRARAVEALQSILLRLLTGIPPAKARFTIIDPVGLGQNFAAFMHLADFEEALVTSRIWTEPQQIEQRLTDLTEHMENVIQKYLRNEFESIEEYNRMAGEVAEPFRFLVVANFPANFTETAARRLLSIAGSGPRCGVHTLITVDTKQALPTGFPMKDLEQQCVNFVWREGRFAWKHPVFEKYPLRWDEPPAPDVFTDVVQVAGEKAKGAGRVEVPFEFIAPVPEQYWQSDSRGGIDVPLGRAGATKLQHLRLGEGTSQHVLIAGKTGSGKSTLMHALIINLALHYSPDEVELYLIDFKKGVEFKTYAAYELAHARVVAVESEREFGLSVLQRLDAELKERGERFRQHGAQNVASYRESNGRPLPRILLIVDEFQEFFIEDDKVAQEAALLLDRLVRQGRAFGIHVHLGSQTLAGAYSLARSTLGQMAVRIALQCSESDAHLILSEDNAAARLLSRPGEAIYNDANGMVEGNNFFQVVWLSEERREFYLGKIREMARQRNFVPPQPQLVFEGNIPSDITKNRPLADLLAAPSWPDAARVATAWLGDAIAIKDPTAAVFRRQSGSHMLVVGQNDEAALGIMASSLLSLAAQHPPTGARFYILDGTPDDSPQRGFLARVAEVLPHPARVVGWTEVAAAFAEVAAEAQRRQDSGDTDAPATYVVLHDLQRYRMLRKADDDFGFSRRGEDEPASPAENLGSLLREGPPLGMHVLAWCDTLNNLNRTFDRQALREFEVRVLFQMSANDSSSLIDSPVANRLGPHRALFSSEEQGRLEKFRPYGRPTDEWLGRVGEQLRAKQEAEEVH